MTKLRTKRQTPIGTMLQLEPLDVSRHSAVFEPAPEPKPAREPVAGIVTIPGAQLGVVREWAEAMGYMIPEEKPEGSSGSD